MRIASAAIYLAGLLLAEALRLPHRMGRVRSSGDWRQPPATRPRSEILVMAAVMAGIWLLPLIYIFTSWLAAFDYHLPDWTVWPALAAFVLSLLLRWRAQADLGASWSPTVELSGRHRLITSGIYGRIRHPLYASLILWAVAQPVLLQNAIAGWVGPIAVALIWLVRVPAEEKMLRERFGDVYLQYAGRTGRLIPKAKKRAA